MNAYDLKRMDEDEKALRKKIDDEIKLDEEIDEISETTARLLESNMMTTFSIQERDFVVIATTYRNQLNAPCIQIVAREKTKIDLSQARVLRADLEIDMNYTRKENLVSGIKALLGHITGRIKPEVLD